MQKIYLTCALLICVLSVHAQSILIRGKVVDERDLPIAGAVVSVSEKKNMAVSDSFGVFQMELKTMPQSIIVQSMGMQDQTLSVSKEPSTLQLVRLISSPKEMDSVVVTGYATIRCGRMICECTRCPRNDPSDSSRKISSLESLISSNQTFGSATLQVYPNPTRGAITISSTQLLEEIQVTDFGGKTLQRMSASGKQQTWKLDLSSYASGMYLIRCYSKTKGWVSKQVVLAK